MKRLISIALVVVALAAVPAAFADTTTPARQQPIPAAKAQKLGQLRLHLKVVAHRLHKQCSGTTLDQKCLDKAQRIADRLPKLQAYLSGVTVTAGATS